MAIDLKGKRISIIGAGRSGLAASRVVKSLGGLPFVSDSSDDIVPETRIAFTESGIECEFGEHSDKIYDCDFIVVSPGVPMDSGVVEKARMQEITVWPEIELAFRLCRGRVIGVTGSNGKTTTTTLIGEILKKGGRDVHVCGNIGRPFVSVAGEISDGGFAVVELSSFQLEMIEEFRCHVAVFLNITPDHLDRHSDFESYISAKARIFENQGSNDLAVMNFDDDRLRELAKKIGARVDWFSAETLLEHGVCANPEGDFFVNGSAVMPSGELKIKGLHNLSNACAAAAVASNIGLEIENIVDVLRSFPGVEHRLEPVRLIGGVSFVNDSKGTNVDSVRWALLAVSAPIILIAGGKEKGGDFW
jgi:UDP-N-acetylmuramoylalanine--D-glutamate ligase